MRGWDYARISKVIVVAKCNCRHILDKPSVPRSGVRRRWGRRRQHRNHHCRADAEGAKEEAQPGTRSAHTRLLYLQGKGRYFFFSFIVLESIFEDISPFCGASCTPDFDFWWQLLPWISMSCWVIPWSYASLLLCNGFLRFTCWPVGSQPAPFLTYIFNEGWEAGNGFQSPPVHLQSGSLTSWATRTNGRDNFFVIKILINYWVFHTELI